MTEYIEREKAKFEMIQEMCGTGYQSWAVDVINRIPTADVVSFAVLEQVMWERDMALETLKEHGIGFCEKSDMVEVVRCKDCIYAHMTISKEEVKYCDMFDSDDGVYFDKNHFCSYGERKGVSE